MVTELQKLVLALIATGAALLLVGFAADDWLTRRRRTAGWVPAFNRLRNTAHEHAQAHNDLVRSHAQLSDHVGHLAADHERLRGELERLLAELAPRRPPSIADPTVRLGPAAAVGRTARMARLDPTWPTENGVPR